MSYSDDFKIDVSNDYSTKEKIATWIMHQSDDALGEITWLLDKAYPIGSEEKFTDDWVDVIVHLEDEL